MDQVKPVDFLPSHHLVVVADHRGNHFAHLRARHLALIARGSFQQHFLDRLWFVARKLQRHEMDLMGVCLKKVEVICALRIIWVLPELYTGLVQMAKHIIAMNVVRLIDRVILICTAGTNSSEVIK